jgi:hypothetical protein
MLILDREGTTDHQALRRPLNPVCHLAIRERPERPNCKLAVSPLPSLAWS